MEALWGLYHNAERMVQWLENLAPLLPAEADAARAGIEAEIRSAREKIERIRQSREGEDLYEQL
ncbi:MAG: hypothetical protein JXB13_18740 [Phycisphaerae bacterium]|nr:hypothetical protein [Phycisphaerae bacterium]